jgi:hypothetical protein
MSSPGRSTSRKRAIQAVLEEEGPLLLDELRWKAVTRAAEEGGEEVNSIDDSLMTSFARTVRDQNPFVTTKLDITENTMLGLVVRCAGRHRARVPAQSVAVAHAPNVVLSEAPRTSFF